MVQGPGSAPPPIVWYQTMGGGRETLDPEPGSPRVQGQPRPPPHGMVPSGQADPSSAHLAIHSKTFKYIAIAKQNQAFVT